MELGPDDFEKSAKEQKSGFQLAPRGTYVMVGTKLQFQKFKSGSKKLSVTVKILKTLSGGQDAKDFVGNNAYLSFWWDLSKEGNRAKLGALCYATYCKEKLNTEDKKALAKAITGRPFVGALEIQESQDPKYGPSQNEREFKRLDQDAIKELMAQPDWAQTVGPAESRWLDDKTIGEGPARSGGSSGKSSTRRNEEEDSESPPF